MALGFALAYLVSYSLYVMVQLGWLHRLFQVRFRPLLSLLVFSLLAIAVAWILAARLTLLAQVIAAGALMLLTLVLQWQLFLNGSERQAFRRRALQIWASGLAYAHQVARVGEPGDSDIQGM